MGPRRPRARPLKRFIVVPLLASLALVGCDSDPRPPVNASASGSFAPGDDLLLRARITSVGQPYDENVGLSLSAAFFDNDGELRDAGVLLNLGGTRMPNRRDPGPDLLVHQFWDDFDLVPLLDCVDLTCVAEVFVAASQVSGLDGSGAEWAVAASLEVGPTGGRTDEAALTIEVEPVSVAEAGLPADWYAPMPNKVVGNAVWDRGDGGYWPVTIEIRNAELADLVVEIIGTAWRGDADLIPSLLDDSGAVISRTTPTSAVLRPDSDMFGCGADGCTLSFIYAATGDPDALTCNLSASLLHPEGRSVPDGAEVEVRIGDPVEAP